MNMTPMVFKKQRKRARIWGVIYKADKMNPENIK